MLYTLGLEGAVSGVTHECEFPPEARQKPVVLRSIFEPSQHSSAEIDQLVREALGRGESIYRPDLEALARIQPDLLITQDICEVCAISYHEVLAVKEALGGRPQILPLNPHSLSEMLADIHRVAAAAGVAARGDEVVAGLKARVDAIAAQAAGAPRLRVLCLEWFEPLFSAGHWVPELVELAGGVEGLGVKHGDSTVLNWADVVAYRPEVLVLMPCGFDVDRTEREMPLLTRLPGWSELPAVRSGRVWGVWGHKYFSGAGPYLVDGLEMLARIIHPARFPDGLPAAVDAKRLV
jgi:iron complex transport system substrate-binding protein